MQICDVCRGMASVKLKIGKKDDAYALDFCFNHAFEAKDLLRKWVAAHPKLASE